MTAFLLDWFSENEKVPHRATVKQKMPRGGVRVVLDDFDTETVLPDVDLPAGSELSVFFVGKDRSGKRAEFASTPFKRRNARTR